MNALIAEASTVTRVLLKNILKRFGIEGTVEATSGALADVPFDLKPAPGLALISAGALREVCAGLREAYPDVYIVAVLSDTRRTRAMLAAGVDEFLLVPDSVQEIEARLFLVMSRLAVRGLLDAAPTIDQLAPETPAEKPPAKTAAPEAVVVPADGTAEEDAPGDGMELVAGTEAGDRVADDAEEEAVADENRDEAGDGRAVTEAPADGAPAVRYEDALFDKEKPPEKEEDPGRPSEELARLIEALKFEEIIVRVLHRQGMRRAELVSHSEIVRQPAYALWLPLLLHRSAKAAWVELRIEMEKAPARALYKKIMGDEPDDEADLLSTLRELMNLIQDASWMEMDNHREAELFIPMRPLALKADEIPRDIWSLNAQRTHYGVRLNEELSVRVTITSQAAARKERLITWLKPLDVLAAPIETEEGRKLLLHRGIMLDESYIEKIQSIIYQYELETKVPVFRPPSGMSVFLDARHNAIITPSLTP